MPEQVEQRTITADVREMRAEGNTLHGFAALYDMESRDLGGFRETVAPGAFADVLAGEPDVYLTFNHSPDKVLARTTSGTLRLRDEERGLAFEADLGDGPTAQDVRSMVARGDVSGASFRFVVAKGGERWEGERRTLTKIARLIDLSLATVPAYDGPRVELRSAPEPPASDPERRADPPPEPEAIVPDEVTPGGLRVEDRSADPSTPESRILDAIRGVPRGECRSLTTADDSAGAVVPPDLRTTLIDRFRETSVVAATGVPVVVTDSKTVVFPTLTDDVAPEFRDELQAFPESDPGLDELEVTPKKLAVLVRASTEALEDSDPSLLQIAVDNVNVSLSVKGDREIVVGSTAVEPRGFDGLLVSAGQSIDLAGAALTYDVLLDAAAMLAEVHAPGPLAALVGPRPSLALAKLKETGTGAYVAPPQGLPRLFSTAHLAVSADVEPTTDVLVYSAQAAMIVVRREITIEVDRSREFEIDAALIRGRYRLALAVAHPEAILRIENVAAPAIEA